MARLGEQLGEWLSRVELLARGAEWHRAEAQRALESGRPWDARAHALTILDELPRSRVALSLWADAAEAALVDNEVVEALERLGEQLPFRADVWLRLAQARERLGQASGSDLSRAAALTEPTAAADAARLCLCDRDLARGDTARAERWLEQLSIAGRGTADAALRRLEVALALGDVERARAAAGCVEAPQTLDARAWLARARWLAASGEGDATPAFCRALLLQAPGVLASVAVFVSDGASADSRSRLNGVVTDLGQESHPIWRAAFASAEGRADEALAALAEGARQSGEQELVARYLAAALAARDPQALAEAARLASESADSPIVALLEALGSEPDELRLAALDRVHGVAAEWAAELRARIFERWCSAEGAVAWRELLAELTRSARALGEVELSRDVEGIARDLDRPLRVAIVGEFNAGKSSLINALLGEDVAPVGVLPTTATLNHLVWAPDRFARIELADRAPDRVVPHPLLRSTLGEIEASSVERVTLFAPLELLRKVELVDTPGFNAPDGAHARAARQAFRDAHAVIWLLDATQPLKASERQVLEEIAAIGLPLCVLMNKIDRLTDEKSLEEARTHVLSGLAQAGIEPESPLVAFSARLALAGRGGDEDARVASRWADVERFVETVLVGQSTLLRDRALRRRAADVARQLGELADARSREQRERIAARREQRERLAELEARAVAQRSEWQRAASSTFAGPVGEFCRQVAPVAGLVGDDGARRFVEGRARDVLAPELSHCLLRPLALNEADAELLGAQVLPRLEALAAGRAVGLVEAARAAESGARRGEGSGELTAVTETLAALAVDEVARAVGSAARSLRPEATTPVFARTAALAAALSR